MCFFLSLQKIQIEKLQQQKERIGYLEEENQKLQEQINSGENQLKWDNTWYDGTEQTDGVT